MKVVNSFLKPLGFVAVGCVCGNTVHINKKFATKWDPAICQCGKKYYVEFDKVKESK